ncbi:MAG: D-alanine--D-alanine ligase [Saprospiraceae bacterium]|nr:D-alanine--D-alanine ligase [Saprospiraceae bacterium]
MKLKVAIIFGGKSAEHSISLISATNIINALDKNIYEPILLGIDKKGEWRYNLDYAHLNVDLTKHDYFEKSQVVYLRNIDKSAAILSVLDNKKLAHFDVGFPIIHGTFGEDGTLQSILEALDIPFVGPDNLGSAIGMDKDVTKRLLRDANIPIARFYSLLKNQKDELSFQEIIADLGSPIFVKPANAGSSVGVTKVNSLEEYENAINLAFRYDNKIIIEEAVIGKEVECAVLGNEHPEASVIGEIVPTVEFYTFEAKYVSTDGAKLRIPADIDADISEQIRKIAIKAFKLLCCEGLSRVDFFLRADNTFVLNEINTLPGFTSISMYPKLWEYSGIPYQELLNRLIELGLQRFKRDKYSYEIS